MCSLEGLDQVGGPEPLRMLKGHFCFVLVFGFSFWPCHAPCGILVPRPGMEPVPPAMEVWSLNHWTTGEVPRGAFLNLKSLGLQT